MYKKREDGPGCVSEEQKIEKNKFILCREKVRSILEKKEKLDDITVKGFKHLMDGEITRSKDCFEALDEKERDKDFMFYGKGLINLLSGDIQEAVLFFERSLSQNPDLSEAWYDKGVALYELDRSKEALECWRRAREVG